MKVAVYARVSTHDQTAENQLIELRRYVAARGWSAVEYVDHGVSGAKDRRPALDQLVADVRRHRVQAVVCWRLDRLGRNLRHLVMLLDDWQSRGIAFVTMGEGINTSTPAGGAAGSMSVRTCRTRRPPHGSMCRSPPSSGGGARRGWGQKGLGDRVISPPFSGGLDRTAAGQKQLIVADRGSGAVHGFNSRRNRP